MKNKKKKKKKGSTLLEIVIALAIIGIMMLPLANSLLTSVKANKMGEETQEAKLLGQQVVEGLKGKEAIKPGNINISGHEFEVTERIPGDKNKLSIKSVNDINNYEVVGDIISSDIVDNNNSKYLDVSKEENKLGVLLVVKKSEIQLIEGTNTYFSIDSLLGNSVLSKGIISTTNDELINIEIEKEKVKISNTRGETIQTASKLNGVLGIYIEEENNTKFNVVNLIEKKEHLYIFREPKLSIEQGQLKTGENNRLSIIGEIYTVKNIIYDIKKNSRGLYDLNLDIKKNNKRIENTNVQFYLGK